jgi:hypothetical protein
VLGTQSQRQQRQQGVISRLSVPSDGTPHQHEANGRRREAPVGATRQQRTMRRGINEGVLSTKKFNVIKLRLFIFTQVHWTLSVSYLVISLRVWHLCGARVRSCAAYHERAHVYVHACALRCVFACARARAQASISLGGGLLGWLVAAGVEM